MNREDKNSKALIQLQWILKLIIKIWKTVTCCRASMFLHLTVVHRLRIMYHHLLNSNPNQETHPATQATQVKTFNQNGYKRKCQVAFPSLNHLMNHLQNSN